MATESKPAAEDVKLDVFEDDDEFEEFKIDEEWEVKEDEKDVAGPAQWADDWDDDDVNDDFSVKLRLELENSTEKN